MTSQVEISIPSAELSQTPKPYTLYNISLRLPLRSFNVQKRYSDFVTLNNSLVAQASQTPPSPLPAKSWFSRTTSNPQLTEERRQGLEAYLKGINSSSDPRWRDTSAWRTFLNLPSNLSSKSSTASTLHSATTSSNAIRDPVVWLDSYQELKSLLHCARLQVTQRDSATSTQAQHEASAQAKKFLVKAGTAITNLDQSLKRQQDDWDMEKLGEGEIRRRRDLVSSARKDKESLESLLSTMVAKSNLDATISQKQALIHNGGAPNHAGGGGGGVRKQGRVLGKETAQTRELDNAGVLQLQKQLMADQDLDAQILGQAVGRQKELAVAIAAELEEQNEMLKLVDEDVDRVQAKIGVASKRIGKIR